MAAEFEFCNILLSHITGSESGRSSVTWHNHDDVIQPNRKRKQYGGRGRWARSRGRDLWVSRMSPGIPRT